MPPSKVFLDTSYMQASLVNSDQHHIQAIKYAWYLEIVDELWTTEAILSELADALGGNKQNRLLALGFILDVVDDERFKIVNVTKSLFRQGLELYSGRSDKGWGLTDCISFAVMRQEGITDALTADHHFVQAGFRALMLEDI